MWIAILVLSIFALLSGLLLGYASIRFKIEGDPVVDQVDAILPQSQCGKCGYPGCRPYAEAVIKGEAEVNLCTPGGETAMLAIARLLDRNPKPFDAVANENDKLVAVIDEANCIGCTLCIQACPVDAILGTAKHMHTVIAAECTGCELCIKPCPVDCITMQPMPSGINNWKWPYPIIPIMPQTAKKEAIAEIS